jgi:hypothetical protein
MEEHDFDYGTKSYRLSGGEIGRWTLTIRDREPHRDSVIVRTTLPDPVWKWVMRSISSPAVSPAETIRDRAVREVDAEHGYTMEFSSSPETHAAEYDKREHELQMEHAQRLLEEAMPILREHGITLETPPITLAIGQLVTMRRIIRGYFPHSGRSQTFFDAIVQDLSAWLAEGAPPSS